MSRRWVPFLLTFGVLAVSITVVDAGVIAAASSTTEPVDVILVAALFLSILFRYEWGLTIAISAGLLRDLLHVSPAVSTISLVLVLVITNTIFRLYVTNRSLWTLLLLGGVATALHRLFLALFQWSFENALQTFALQFVLHSILLMGLYAITWVLGTRLKSYILVWR